MELPPYHFPEDAYLPAPDLAAEYWRRVALGRARACDLRVVVCALARNLGRARVLRFASAVHALVRPFSAWGAILFENDSTDDTLAALHEWARHDSRVEVLSESLGRPLWGQVRDGARGTHMAEYRNRCREHAIERFHACDLVLVIDSDIGQYSIDGLMSSVGQDGWDALGSNGLAVMKGRFVQFDAWAWRDLDHPAAHRAKKVKKRIYDRGHGPVPVLSCFGGMMLYRMPAFRASRYEGGDCEHVGFHFGMARAGHGRIFMNPAQVVQYQLR